MDAENKTKSSSLILPLTAAYRFASNTDIASEVDQIRNMSIDDVWRKRGSSVRRAYIVQLFREQGCLDDFINQHWSVGLTQEGQKKIRQYEEILTRYTGQLPEDSSEEAEAEEEMLSQGFALESQLRDYLAHNLGLLEPGLKLYRTDTRDGVEFPVDGGRIDILAVSDNGQPVVIELKLSRGRNKALGQLAYYMGWVDRNFPNGPCRGIIVAEKISPELSTAIERVPGVSLYRYQISMNLEPVVKVGLNQ